MKPGDVVESAIWLSGTETEQQIADFKELIRKNTAAAAINFRVEVGPFEWKVKRPGEDRVPQVPDAISGIDVRLLVGEAKVIAANANNKQTVSTSGFINDLRPEDLLRLRRITRQTQRKVRPDINLTNQQCDAFIESLGPEAALKTLRCQS